MEKKTRLRLAPRTAPQTTTKILDLTTTKILDLPEQTKIPRVKLNLDGKMLAVVVQLSGGLTTSQVAAVLRPIPRQWPLGVYLWHGGDFAHDDIFSEKNTLDISSPQP